MYAVTQASEILYRRFNGSSFQFTGHNNLPNAEALKINFSEESVRSAYYQAILIEPACNGVIDPEDFLDAIDSLDEYGYSTEYHAVVPQWRSPDRTSNVTAETVYVQPHQNYYQSYAVGGQTILSPTIALERSLHVNGAAYTVGALKDAIACTQEFQYFGMPLASVYLDAQGDYVTVDATGITKFPHAVVVIGWIDGVSQTDFIFLDNRHEAIQVLSSEYFVGHPEGFHLLKFLWNVPAPTVDDDGDLIPDIVDNCPAVDDDSQADLDDDGTGDPCDMDRDGDGVPNTGDPVLDLAPDEYWKALDLNGNSYNAWYLERSTTAQQVGNRYRTYGCESECLQYEPGNPYCLLDCESLGVDPVLPMENHDRCLRRNYYHPDCQAQVKTAADAAGQTLPNYLRSFHPCALVYPTKLQSYEDISARISAGELNFGWGTPGNFSFWLQERFLDCVNYMNPSHWTADRSISLSTITEGKSKYLGPGYYLMYSCEATAFQAYYEKNTEAPVGSYSGWSWMEVDDDHAMISGCPCQGEGVYPDGCATRCVDEDQGAEPQSDNSQSIASNSWDPLYSNNAPNSFSSDGPEALPPISSFSTNLKVTAAANTLILRKHEFFDYDYWIDDEGELEDYQELNPSLPGSFQMRYSKHNAFFSGVPIPGGYMGREIEAAEFSEAFHFTTQEGCTSRFAITNWVAANVRTIPAAALSGPQWGLWKVATEGQMVMGFDATGTRTHRMALIPDAVTAMRVLSTTDPENATFLAARTVSGVLNNFRKYRYSNFSMVDEGAVTVSGIPTLTSVSLVPLNDTTTLVVGKSTITTWKLYQLVVSGSTGTLTYLTSLGLTSSLQAIWEPSVKLVPRATIVTNAYSTVKRYTLSNSTLTLVYSISQNTPVNSLARTDQGLVAILGNAVTLLGESSPTTTVLGAYPDLPADLYGHTLVPRTSLRLWGKGGSGQLGGYQYYPMMDQWETVQCLQNL